MADLKTEKRAPTSIIFLILIIIASFIINLWALLQYPPSYGPDGPFYDICVRNILQTGYPNSDDPPLVYYYLVPFVLMARDSHLGIKIGMSLIGALMGIPGYLLTEYFTKNRGAESKVPALLTAFCISINIFELRLIEDFMQNLAGGFFLLCVIYTTARWLEHIQQWKKFGILTVVFLGCNIGTHLYTGGLGILVFAVAFLASFVIKWKYTHKLPHFEFWFIIIIAILAASGIIGLYLFFPDLFSYFYSRISSYAWTFYSNLTTYGWHFNPMMLFLLTLPTMIGLFIALRTFFGAFSKQDKSQEEIFTHGDSQAVLGCVYVTLSLIIFLLVGIISSWQQRFLLIAFIPISLQSGLFLKKIEQWFNTKPDLSLRKKRTMITIMAVTFCISTFANAWIFIPKMGPTITLDQYREMTLIRDQYRDNLLVNNIVHVGDGQFAYWAEWILDMDVVTDRIVLNATEYKGKVIYEITKIRNVQGPFRADFQYPWNPLLPMRIILVQISGNTRSIQSNLAINQLPPQNPPNQPNAPNQPQQNIIPPGLVIYRGQYLALSIIKYANDTIVPIQPKV